jgi:hypothetical protein
MKKYDNIEQQITEGFWDAIVNKAKGIGLTTKAALGSNYAKGQLDTHTLATELYNQFKQWSGRVGAKGTRNDVADFLVHQVNLGVDFVNQELKIKYNGSAPEIQGASQPQQSQQSGGNDYDSLVGTSSTGGTNGENVSTEKYEPAPDEFQPNLSNIARFMKTAIWTQFKEQRDATGYDQSTAVPFTKTPDGTFIFADKDEEDELRKLIQVVNVKPVETADEMKRDNFFITWEDFKNKVPGASRIGKDTPEEADLFRQSCFQALSIYGKNFPKALHRFILAIPPETPNRQAAKDSLAIIENKELTEDAEDAALRKLFAKIAQDAIRSGAFRHAAHSYADHLRQGGRFYGDYQAAPGQDAPQEPQQEDLLAKAKQLGDYLGIKLSKWDLRAFRNKNKQMFYDFMTDLKNENPEDWDPDFIEHCKAIFNIKGEIPGPQGQEQENNHPGMSQIGKGQAANDAGPGQFIDIRGEHIKWDEKDGTLTIGTRDARNGNKIITRVYEPLASGGWAERGTGRQFSAQNGFAAKLTDLQDEYMKATGMDKPQDMPNAEEIDGIPVGAKVKANNGEYTFNGSEWKNAEGQAVTSEKSINWLNDQYEKQKNGAEMPMQPAHVEPKQAEQPKPAEQHQSNVIQPIKPAEPEQAVNNKQEVPNNATFTIPNTNRVIQRKPDGWVDNKGQKITNPSQVELFDRGWMKKNRPGAA